MDLADICRAAIQRGASDVHLKVGKPPMLRIDGLLTPLSSVPPLPPEAIGRMAWGIMSPQQRERFKARHDLDMSWQVSGLGRFRVNVFRQRNAVGMVLRVVPAKVRTIDELHLPAALKDVVRTPRGLILVTGATGAGKSTTLAAMVEEINQHFPWHVLTIEDPIEYVFRDRKAVINQREIGTDSESFAIALRAALRQDPDVILVGELRDRESMEIALQAADTGHLVLATVHTMDATETVHRILGFFEPHHHQQIRYQLASCLRAILSQRLVPAKQGGRIAAMEVLVNSGVITECIADPDRLREIPDHLARDGGGRGSQTFDQALYRLVRDGLVEPRVALHHASNPDELSLRLRGIGDDWD